MTKNEFLNELEEILEADAGTITGDEVLNNLAGWDSLTTMVFIAMVDEKFNINISASKLADSKNVGDLISLLGDNISG